MLTHVRVIFGLKNYSVSILPFKILPFYQIYPFLGLDSPNNLLKIKAQSHSA